MICCHSLRVCILPKSPAPLPYLLSPVVRCSLPVFHANEHFQISPVCYLAYREPAAITLSPSRLVQENTTKETIVFLFINHTQNKLVLKKKIQVMYFERQILAHTHPHGEGLLKFFRVSNFVQRTSNRRSR